MKSRNALIGKNMNTSRIIYSINVEDIQNVAKEHLGRQATKKELKRVEDKLGNYIDWHEAIILAIDNAVNSQEN